MSVQRIKDEHFNRAVVGFPKDAVLKEIDRATYRDLQAAYASGITLMGGYRVARVEGLHGLEWIAVSQPTAEMAA